MKRAIVSSLVMFLIFAAFAGCGGKSGKSSSSSSTTTITVAVSPSSASVTTGATQQFTATVSNSTNTAVTWSVNGVAGGNQTVGFISSTGLYTAPGSVPTPAAVTVAATSQANTAVTGSATVTVTGPATPSSSMVVSPAFVNVPAAGQQTFTATVSGNPIAVNWAVNCQSQAAGACGTISAAGIYTAPASPPPGGNVGVTATAQDKSVPASGAVVTVQFSNGTLNGQYAFTMSGQNAGITYLAAGSISFDGAGNITAGVMDINSGGTVTAAAAINAAGSTYHIGTDGRGNATVQTSAGTFTWRLAAVNQAHVYVARFDAGVAGASGTMDLQDATQFTLGLGGFSGSYGFNLSGATSSGTQPAVQAGALNANGAGGISGTVDFSTSGTFVAAQSVSGTYTAPSASGRGTILLSGGFSNNFAYYIVDATHIKVIETDPQYYLGGDLYRQAAGPFSNATYRGGLAFVLSGVALGRGPHAEGGLITMDGTNTGAASGRLDINENGNTQTNLQVSGSYSVTDATTGRATLSLTAGTNTLHYVMYPSSGGVSLMGTDYPTIACRALPQSAAPFSGGSLTGNYALNVTGTDLINPGELDIVGQLLPNAGSAFNTSVVDVNDNGNLTPAASLSGSYQVSSNGRGTSTLNSSSIGFAGGTFTMYVVDSGDVLWLETDSHRVLVGTAQKQF